ncbi:MAG: tRNA pseudouridine(55) synthase TruB [Clostridia bacterium]|nr:tRNA pseudouridine(55) synthase TruB [Clostridia bacterium]
MNGFIIIDKPVGISSFKALGSVKRLSRGQKVGHTGTLDPLASGVLPAAVGRATAFIDLLPDCGKRYSAGFRLGITTDTLDITGEVISQKEVTVSPDEIRAVIKSFEGRIKQVPPMYSALKKDGERLYKLARRGVTVEREARDVEIYSIDNITGAGDGWSFDCSCSSGTYIRSLISDIGEKLGCGACMTALRRTYSNGFSVENARTPDEISEKDSLAGILIPIDSMFTDFGEIILTQAQSFRFANGNAIDRARLKGKEPDGEYRVFSPGRVFLGLARLGGNELTAVKTMGEEALSDLRLKNGKTAAALGTFDGLHLGHMSVIKKALGTGYRSLVLLFSEHPQKVLNGAAPGAIIDPADEDMIIRSLGAEPVRIDFAEIHDMSPRDFVSKILKDRLNAGFVSCGFNYRFGKGGEGNAETLRTICGEYGIDVGIADEVDHDGSPVSSTRIREAIAAGNVTAAGEMLGRAYSYNLVVEHGQARGRTLGFPTINQRFPEGFCLPGFGVYRSLTEVDGKPFGSVTNVGVRPTVGSDAPSSETYIDGYSGDLYGRKIRVSLLRFLRPERKFDSVDELKRQVEKDIEEARRL